MKALDKASDFFSYIAKTFPGLSMKKLKESIFHGSQIRKLMQDQTFTARMTVAERATWCSYVPVIREFLGNTKACKYRNFVDMTLQNFQILGARMSIKLNYLFSYLDYFPENLGNKKRGTKAEVPSRHLGDGRKIQGRWDSHMMADYCCTSIRDCTEQIHSRKSYKQTFLHMNS